MQTLANLLVMSGLMNRDQVKKVFDAQKKTGDPFIKTMINLGYSSEEKVATFLAKYFKTEFIQIDKEDIPIPVLNLVSEDMANKYQLIPYKKVGNMLFIAMINPANLNAIDDVKFKTGLDVIPVVTTESSLMNSMGTYRKAHTQVSEYEDEDDLDIDIDLDEDSEEDVDDIEIDFFDEEDDDDFEVVGGDSGEVIIGEANLA
ncbi:hypothetical protein KAU15_03440, partial [candidate division WOR-3 bacterium]|nr:hypothetical protein [candidate division WOR-3 bacterium]